MTLKTKGSLNPLIVKITSLPIKLMKQGELWAKKSAENAMEVYKHNLETQGRPGGFGEPISDFTRRNPSDGSGIRDHVKVKFKRQRNKVVATMGIEDPKATMIAQVQEHGTTVLVTEDMADYLAAKGLNVQPGGHIEIPGRKSWSRAIKQSFLDAKHTIRVII